MKFLYNYLMVGLFGVLLFSFRCADEEKNPLRPHYSLPVLTTSEVGAITQTTASCGGTITSDGAATVTARGVCWSTGLTPTVADNKSNDGTGAGAFTSTLTGLSAGTTYYVRAYATNAAGSGYGSAFSFTTKANTPPTASFTVSPAGGTLQTDFQVDASATSDTEYPSNSIKVRWDWEDDGIWDTAYSLEKTAAHRFSTEGEKIIKLGVMDAGGLIDSTMHQVSVLVPSGETGTVSDVDGNIYRTIKIGRQWWMAENLKVTRYRNGESLLNVTEGASWNNLTTGAWCSYHNDDANAATYGQLYNWYALADVRQLAPAGWHIPSDAEWKELEIYLGMNPSVVDTTGMRGGDQGDKLKEMGVVHWLSPNTSATNESGFTALPGGYRGNLGVYEKMAYGGYFWSSTESGGFAWSRILISGFSGVFRYTISKDYGFSLRCIKD